ncbi:MAG: aldo/keto reductase, partial [Bacteroidota bacterium]
MKNRHLGKNGFEVSEVGLGCWQLGSDWGSEISKKKAFEILNKAVDCGITFFDTADVYGGGRSEELIGEFLQTSNSEVKVATKFGRKSDLFPDNYSEQALRECVDDSR